MIERTPILNIVTHAILVFGLLLLLLPMYLVIVAASHSLQDVVAVPPNLLPGDQLWINLQAAWAKGKPAASLPANCGAKSIGHSMPTAGSFHIKQRS